MAALTRGPALQRGLQGHARPCAVRSHGARRAYDMISWSPASRPANARVRGPRPSPSSRVGHPHTHPAGKPARPPLHTELLHRHSPLPHRPASSSLPGTLSSTIKDMVGNGKGAMPHTLPCFCRQPLKDEWKAGKSSPPGGADEGGGGGEGPWNRSNPSKGPT
jgi:hypothetical protein